MKKIFFASALLIAASFISANAVSVSENIGKGIRKQIRKERRARRRELWLHSVNSITENRFYTDFPNAKDVTWTRDQFMEASFYAGKVLKTAYYDPDNQLVGTTTDIDYAILPAKARLRINKKYPGYSVRTVILFDDNESNDTDMFLFSNRFNDEDIYFAVLSNGVKEIVLKVTVDGNVAFFQNYK